MRRGCHGTAGARVWACLRALLLLPAVNRCCFTPADSWYKQGDSRSASHFRRYFTTIIIIAPVALLVSYGRLRMRMRVARFLKNKKNGEKAKTGVDAGLKNSGRAVAREIFHRL